VVSGKVEGIQTMPIYPVTSLNNGRKSAWRLTIKVIRWLLVVSAVLYIATGFGITEFRTVETVTSGLLTKSLSFALHNSLFLLVPSIALLVLHIYFSFISGQKNKRA